MLPSHGDPPIRLWDANRRNRSRVGDKDDELLVMPTDRNKDIQFLAPRAGPMLQGIFDQTVDGHRRDLDGQAIGVDLKGCDKVFLGKSAQAEVTTAELDLLLNRNQRRALGVHRRTQKLGKLLGELTSLRGVLQDEGS